MNSTKDKKNFAKLQAIYLYVIEKRPASEIAKLKLEKYGYTSFFYTFQVISFKIKGF